MEKPAILYIDDDRDDQEVFVEVLKRIRPNISCHLASDGRQGLLLLRKLEVLPICIYLDLNMPVMNGLEVLKEIKGDPRYRDIPTFILSTSQNPNAEVQARDLGAEEYLKKPNSYSAYTDLLSSCFLAHLQEYGNN
ncbi:MAG TPA: response regulator [Chryseosolibacter sp.]